MFVHSDLAAVLPAVLPAVLHALQDNPMACLVVITVYAIHKLK